MEICKSFFTFLKLQSKQKSLPDNNELNTIYALPLPAEIIVLSDNAKSDGNTITRTGEGTIYAIIKHKTKWDFGSSSTNFYIYSDIIEIN